MFDAIEDYLERDLARLCVVPGWLNFPDYYVTIDGRVWSIPRVRKSKNNSVAYHKGHWLRPSMRKGYVAYTFCINYEMTKVNRARILKLVFDGPPSQELLHLQTLGHKIEIRHLNDNALDDRLENLEWGTQFDNAKDRQKNKGYAMIPKQRTNAKLTVAQVSEIKRMLSDGMLGAQIAPLYGVSSMCIYSIKKGYSWEEIQPLIPQT